MTGRQNGNLAADIRKLTAMSYLIHNAAVYIGVESLLIYADPVQIIELAAGKRIYQEVL